MSQTEGEEQSVHDQIANLAETVKNQQSLIQKFLADKPHEPSELDQDQNDDPNVDNNFTKMMENIIPDRFHGKKSHIIFTKNNKYS